MISTIHFFNEDIAYILKQKRIMRLWIDRVIQKAGLETGDLNFVLCNDEFLVKMNRKYLKHNTLTDIITFALSDDTKVVSGDIYISLQRVRENAKIFNLALDEELHRVMIHGILHLVGFKDTTKEEKEEMRRRESEALELLEKVKF